MADKQFLESLGRAYMSKVAYELQDHQKRVVDKLYSPDKRGVIAYHSMGAGKTLTALDAMKKAPGKKLMITPASLVDNVRKEAEKHGIKLGDDIEVMSYEYAVRNADLLNTNKYSLVIFDEAHRLRNADTARVQKLTPIIQNAGKVLMLSGTAGYNHPSDMAQLVHLIDPELKIPVERKDFESRYIDPETWGVKNKEELKSSIGKYIDVHNTPAASTDFPTTSERIIHTPMSDKQTDVYRFVEKSMPSVHRKAMRNNLPLSLRDTAQLNMFASGVRQAAVSPRHFDVTSVAEDSPKLIAAADSMAEHAKHPNFRGVAYSNYLDSGLDPFAELLRKRGLDPMVFTGKLSAKEKKRLVDTYNDSSTDPRILLLSSSGGEGLDLKGTRLMQILEPHFNQSKIDQVKARGARYKSHAHLPEKERHMDIEQYHSVLPERWWHRRFGISPDTAIDDYLHDASQRKQRVIDEIKNIVSTD